MWTNRLLASLPDDDQRRMAPHWRNVPLRARHTLLRQGQPIQEIIFPTGGVCSLSKTTDDGHSIEVIGVGREGAIGACVVIGQSDSPADVIVQVPAEALALPLDVFRAELQAQSALSRVMIDYCGELTLQLMQASACHALHSAVERCCRWLLTTDDRMHSASFPITQEMMAMLLGIRRPTVTLIMADLHRAGIVEYTRGSLQVRDRAALLSRACECYSTLSVGLRKVA